MAIPERTECPVSDWEKAIAKHWLRVLTTLISERDIDVENFIYTLERCGALNAVAARMKEDRR